MIGLMWAALAGTLLRCQICRWIGIALLATGAAWIAWQRARSNGAEAERLAQRQRSLETRITNLKERRHAEEDAGRRSVAERRERVRRYQRPEP